MAERSAGGSLVEKTDDSGEILVRIAPNVPLAVTLGASTKARYEPLECAVAVHSLVNEALGVALVNAAATTASRSPVGGRQAAEQGEVGTIDQRLDRVWARLAAVPTGGLASINDLIGHAEVALSTAIETITTGTIPEGQQWPILAT